MQFTALDITAIAIIILGVIVCIMELLLASLNRRWWYIYVLQALGGLGLAFAFSVAILTGITGGTPLVSAGIGRPMAILVLFSMAIGALFEYRRGK